MIILIKVSVYNNMVRENSIIGFNNEDNENENNFDDFDSIKYDNFDDFSNANNICFVGNDEVCNVMNEFDAVCGSVTPLNLPPHFQTILNFTHNLIYITQTNTIIITVYHNLIYNSTDNTIANISNYQAVTNIAINFTHNTIIDYQVLSYFIFILMIMLLMVI